ncbi:hypothetical protein FRC17_004417 [Serendipita sp. 399]|nr:hypothetical protein FRC17_004417 [Serendipita sp. 399]
MGSVSSSLFISSRANFPEALQVDALSSIPSWNVRKKKQAVKTSSGNGSKTRRAFPTHGRLVGAPSSPKRPASKIAKERLENSSQDSSPGPSNRASQVSREKGFVPSQATTETTATTPRTLSYTPTPDSPLSSNTSVSLSTKPERPATHIVATANEVITDATSAPGTSTITAALGAAAPVAEGVVGESTNTTAAIKPAPKPAPLIKSFASLLRGPPGVDSSARVGGGGGGAGGEGLGPDGPPFSMAGLPIRTAIPTSSQIGFTVPAISSSSSSIAGNAENDAEQQSIVASLAPHQHASLIRLLKTGVGIPSPTTATTSTSAAGTVATNKTGAKSTSAATTSKSLQQQQQSSQTSSWSSSPQPGSSAPQIVPRGLVNTGNLCFANAILQALVYTPPFWKLFSDLGSSPLMRERRNARAKGSVSTTPMVDAVIDFLNEFKPTSGPGPIDGANFPTASAAASMPTPASDKQSTGVGSSGSGASKSASREPGVLPRNSFKASGVYNSLKSNPSFDAMRLGQQEDAEEFLGFFLDGLHEELGKLLHLLGDSSGLAVASSVGGDGRSVVDDGVTSVDGETDGGVGGDGDDNEWQEVGRKNRAMVTRTTKSSESAITAIFGGKIRSVLRASGRTDSASVEEWRCLQLDIQPPHVRSIEDALYGISAIETVSIQSRQGHQVDATKQMLLENLPPILILQLKRFIYDPLTGIGKSTKHVQYGPELEIRSAYEYIDLLSPNLKNQQGSRRYKLYGIIFHHGLSATGGHYTLDVLHPHPSSYATPPASSASTSTSTSYGAASRPKSNLAANGPSHQQQQQQPHAAEGWVRFNDEFVRLLTPEDVFTKPHPSVNANPNSYSALVAGALAASKRESEDRVAYLLLYRRVGR